MSVSFTLATRFELQEIGERVLVAFAVAKAEAKLRIAAALAGRLQHGFIERRQDEIAHGPFTCLQRVNDLTLQT